MTPTTARRIVLRCPELTLKGKNRSHFEQTLLQNVRHRLRRLGSGWPVHHAHGRIYVDVESSDPARVAAVVDAMTETAGADSVVSAVWLRPTVSGQHTGELDVELIEKIAVDLAREHFEENSAFAVRVNRVDKRLPLTSMEMERWLGAAIRRRTSWDRVDLGRPDRTIAVDVYPDGIYFHAGKREGIGGLPVGTGGRVLALLSGGIDSPVAAFLLAKRGCTVDFFHLTATYGQQRDDDTPVARLARHLSRYTLRSRLFTAPATRLDLSLFQPATGFEAILFRRFLVRCASTLAGRIGASALVVGDSLGQVASQTVENLASVYQAADIPVLQPLIGFNKQETIALARRIGTYDTSIERYKDCCALLAQSPRTRSDPERLSELEERLLPDYATLVESTLAEIAWRRFDCGEAVGEWRSPRRDEAAETPLDEVPASRPDE